MENYITKRLALILALLMLLPLCYFSHEAKADTLSPLVDRSEELNVTAVIEINSPQNTTYSTREILLNFTLVYEGQDYDVGYSVDGGAIQRIQVSKISEKPAPYLFMPPYVRVTCRGTIVLRDLSDGIHAIVVYGGYYYGGINQRFEVFKRASTNFTIDTVAPNISLLSPETKVYNISTLSLNFTVNEPVSQLTYSLDGQKNVTISGNTTLTNLSYGEHNVTVYATDEVGIIGVSETISFTITEPPEPFPTTLVVASVITVVVVGIGLIVYFKKRKH
ncbi:hypothetical protein JW988_04100 [Candidatus Bathyarchaeota archaeon]|nr:hypothetical protein [Candidatus Bathyarchaeota archaeon]